MRVSVFGLGYVGCVTAACLAQAGHEVVGVDVNRGQGRDDQRGHVAHRRAGPRRSARARSSARDGCGPRIRPRRPCSAIGPRADLRRHAGPRQRPARHRARSSAWREEIGRALRRAAIATPWCCGAPSCPARRRRVLVPALAARRGARARGLARPRGQPGVHARGLVAARLRAAAVDAGRLRGRRRGRLRSARALRRRSRRRSSRRRSARPRWRSTSPTPSTRSRSPSPTRSATSARRSAPMRRR